MHDSHAPDQVAIRRSRLPNKLMYESCVLTSSITPSLVAISSRNTKKKR
jgi:hypothetical protein